MWPHIGQPILRHMLANSISALQVSDHYDTYRSTYHAISFCLSKHVFYLQNACLASHQYEGSGRAAKKRTNMVKNCDNNEDLF